MWASFLYNDDSAAGGKSGLAVAAAGERHASTPIAGKPQFAPGTSGRAQTPKFSPTFFKTEPASREPDAALVEDDGHEEFSPVDNKHVERVDRTGKSGVNPPPDAAHWEKPAASTFFQTAPPRLDAAANAWSSNTAPPSAATGKAGGSSSGTGASSASGNGVERHGYISFSEVQLDDEDQDDDRVEVGSWGSFGSFQGGSLRNSGRMSQEVLQKRFKKRARAWRRFSAVMEEHGLRVRKHHRRGKGWANRVVKYDSELPGLRWKSSKWWDSSGGQLPLRDVLDVERSGKVVWVKCLHLGTVGFEASLESDSVIFYLAMDSLLNKRCGVDERTACITGPVL